MTREEYLAQVDSAYGKLRGGDLERRLQMLLLQSKNDTKDGRGPYAAMLNEMGAYYRYMMRLSESEDYFNQAVALTEELMGKTSADYATAVLNLAGTHRMQEKFELAEEEYGKVIALYENSIGTDNPFYYAALNNLSLVFLDTRRFEAAKEIQQLLLSTLSANESLVEEKAATLCNLGSVCFQLKEMDEAEEHLTEALTLYEGGSAEIESHYYSAVNTLGLVREHQGQYAEAASQFEKALEGTLLMYGDGHPQTEEVRANLSRVKEKLS